MRWKVFRCQSDKDPEDTNFKENFIKWNYTESIIKNNINDNSGEQNFRKSNNEGIVLQVYRIDFSYWITVTNLIQRILEMCKETFLKVEIQMMWVIWIEALHQKNIFSQKILHQKSMGSYSRWKQFEI